MQTVDDLGLRPIVGRLAVAEAIRKHSEIVNAADSFLREIYITHVMDCLADPTKIRVIAELSEDVQPVLPYLAALLPRAGYNHAAGIMTLLLGGRLLTVYPRVVTLAKALDEEDAQDVLEWLRDRINEADARRGELAPCLGRRRSPRILDAYKLLPGTNCGSCGELTCMALAARLIFGEAGPADCPRLRDAGFERNRERLAEWLGDQTQDAKANSGTPRSRDDVASDATSRMV
jgi:ArsR family metal-binding transcriptional regulator